MATSEVEARVFGARLDWHLRTQTPIESLTTTVDETECRFRIWLVKHTISAPNLGFSIANEEIRAILVAHDWDYVSATLNLLLR